MSNSFPKVSRWPLDRLCEEPQCATDAPRQPALHCARGRRRSKAFALQYAADELLAQLFAQRHWLVFSSKSRSPYTQMFLTHLDAEGNSSPAILIDNATAANRAVNIPSL